ncbi:glycosyl transferase, partial [Pseudomonas donghuensis]|nr:glycosyl transferase [Pseudomonas donghuensis]
SIGRSIAGNNKPLYDYLFAYNGDQMAGELNMQSKHSIEKQTALHVDCFTTVSDITAKECKELLDKPVDVVLPNGFE